MQQEYENNTWSVVSFQKEKGLWAADGYTRLNLEYMTSLRDIKHD
jgi:hypothetical protein